MITLFWELVLKAITVLLQMADSHAEVTSLTLKIMFSFRSRSFELLLLKIELTVTS
jgi:hypothetical protein